MKSKKNNNLEQNRIHIHQSTDEVNRYQKAERNAEKKYSTVVILLLIWIAVFFISLFCTIAWQQWNFSLALVLQYVSFNIEHFYHFVMGNGPANGMDSRFYQYLIISLAGAALAACGAVFQGGMRNTLASPSTMGVMSGGSLGCTLYLLFFTSSALPAGVAQANPDSWNSMSLWEQYQQQFCILLGCLAGVSLIMTISFLAGKGKLSASAMLISGMVFSSVVKNFALLIQYYMIVQDSEDPRIDAIRDLMLGNLSNVGTLPILIMMAIPIGLCLILLLAISGRLNLLAFGDMEAAAMGISVQKYRNLIILAGTVLTAVVVAFCGQIGFIGFMVPLITRKITGPDMRKLLPASMLTGAIFLILVFDLAYFTGLTDSMNVITSGLGCIVMLTVLVRKGGKTHAADQTAGSPGMGIR